MGLGSTNSGISPPTAALSLQALPGARGWLRRLGEPLGLQPPEQEAVLRVLDAGLERCLALHAACIPLPGHRYGGTGREWGWVQERERKWVGEDSDKVGNGDEDEDEDGGGSGCGRAGALLSPAWIKACGSPHPFLRVDSEAVAAPWGLPAEPAAVAQRPVP